MSEVYPVNDYGPLMPGLVMAAVAVVHVFLAQFAVGGGFLLSYFQWLAMTGRSPHARQFVKGYFRALVLISFVVGALSGVGVWFAAIQVSPATIGAMVHDFHWLWAIEWTFFCLEIVAGYCFYRYLGKLSDRAALGLLLLYSAAAWFSLFIINGILSWQLTPGAWVETRRVADGFFNPGFWPSLLFRTVVSTTLAALVACLVVNTMSELDREARRALINRAAQLLIPMVSMPVLGVWYLAVLPDDSRSWVLGGSAAMTLFLNLSVGASLAVGAYALVGLVLRKLYVNAATAGLLVFLAFGATAGGEFVREGSRKPYSIRHVLYSNGVRPEEVTTLRKTGCLANDPYPLRAAADFPHDQVRRGALVYRRLCSVCHTLEGANGLVHLTGTWDRDQMRMNIAKLQHTKPFMPPFAGSADDLEALVQFLEWQHAGRPQHWGESREAAVLQQIAAWLEEAGTEPGDVSRKRPQPSEAR
jgi:mono/diheme cytochrome c family protein